MAISTIQEAIEDIRNGKMVHHDHVAVLVVEVQELRRLVPIASVDQRSRRGLGRQRARQPLEMRRIDMDELVAHRPEPRAAGRRHHDQPGRQQGPGRRAAPRQQGPRRPAREHVGERAGAEQRRHREGVLDEALRDQRHEYQDDRDREQHARALRERRTAVHEHEQDSQQVQDEGPVRREELQRVHRADLAALEQLDFMPHGVIHAHEVLDIEEPEVLREIGVQQHGQRVGPQPGQQDAVLAAPLHDLKIGPAQGREDHGEERRDVGERV